MFKIKTGPATEPVTLTEAKAFLGVTSTDDDTLITELIEGAREVVESYTRRSLFEQTLELSLDNFPHEGQVIRLPRPPVLAISSITYIDTAGDSQVWSSALYEHDTKSDNVQARVRPVWGEAWPSARAQIDSVVIEYTAGVATVAEIPTRAKVAVKNLVAEWFNFREPVIVGGVTEIPGGVKRILNSLMVHG